MFLYFMTSLTFLPSFVLLPSAFFETLLSLSNSHSLCGLVAATHLHSSGIPFLLLEASNDVGGHNRTDVVDGLILDRGFQIFITAYPKAHNLLDYPSLNLQKIYFDRELETTSRLFDFIFKCLELGDNTLPVKGIAEIPNQLASKLSGDCIRLNLRVVSIEVHDEKRVNVRLDNGEMLRTEIGYQ